MLNLPRLAELLRARNTVESNIANLLQCDVDLSHIGEQIAASIFGIRLVPTLNPNGPASIFTQATLLGKTVDIRWYPRREGFLNIHTDPAPDYTLVLAGPKLDPNEARALVNPWIISSAYLFHMPDLLATLRARCAHRATRQRQQPSLGASRDFSSSAQPHAAFKQRAAPVATAFCLAPALTENCIQALELFTPPGAL